MSDTDLRWQLRQLPRELDPPRDLWPGIAGRLQRAPARRRPWLIGLAMAASLGLALGLAWQMQGAVAAPGSTQEADFRAELVRREAQALTREYQAALESFEGAPLPAPLEPALETLDRSAAEIRLAMAADPDSLYLLDQLRRTYARRLSLTQRAVMG